MFKIAVTVTVWYQCESLGDSAGSVPAGFELLILWLGHLPDASE